ncbi:MAG: membrane protein insertion efficiency factor YidD [Candidatus Omnitrophota bacterium]
MLQRLSLFIIKFYQNYIRIFLPCSCRFWPTCSEYTKEAILEYGFWKGAYRGLRRLLRCQPLSKKSGFDPLV